MNEEELLREAQRGNRSALESLLQENYKIIYGYTLKISMNEETARDLTQEAMLKAVLNIKKFKGNSKFSTWLVSIVSNLYKDKLRRNRLKNVDFDKLDLHASENVEDSVINREEIGEIKKILMDMPEKKRMVFILKHYYNYSYEEISKILKCPVGTVRSRLHYCVKKIQESLQGGVYDE